MGTQKATILILRGVRDILWVGLILNILLAIPLYTAAFIHLWWVAVRDVKVGRGRFLRHVPAWPFLFVMFAGFCWWYVNALYYG